MLVHHCIAQNRIIDSAVSYTGLTALRSARPLQVPAASTYLFDGFRVTEYH
jgi:hypothetical protein